ncbi:S24 family peptidase [Zhengella mangrovi]|nr:S24 family peptidase [Zhengella mangrovi]
MLKGTRAISGDELIAISTITGFDAPRERVVPIVGRVGAGAVVEATEDGNNGEQVEAPAQSVPSTVAVEVVGDSMFPAYEPGDLIFYSRHLPADEMLNRRAVVKLATGEILVKRIRPGSTAGFHNLESLNPLFSTIEDTVIEWAAPIDWSKPR